jgi:hypothetical protein
MSGVGRCGAEEAHYIRNDNLKLYVEIAIKKLVFDVGADTRVNWHLVVSRMDSKSCLENGLLQAKNL